ncbi:NolY [Bradyrhizobium sp. Arg816]|uniref:NolY n=1 Tax=Bradyrhizobium sp. Arg816 TaxID=2998491 RepID=UPI00249E6AF8|nr:NolY [Bradyrhizobium sp. Arg816]MDI3567324.1 NolY [Bradyrhizobium sp. Arg816]
MELDPSNSRSEDLEDRIDLQLDIVAALIREEGNELEAIRLLNALTNQMITAELELGQLGDTRTEGRAGDRQTTRLSRDRGVYYPEDLQDLGRLHDQAVAALPPELRTPANQMKIAKLILSRAAADRDFL